MLLTRKHISDLLQWGPFTFEENKGNGIAFFFFPYNLVEEKEKEKKEKKKFDLIYFLIMPLWTKKTRCDQDQNGYLTFKNIFFFFF